MTIKILRQAREDLLLGMMFYNQQEKGLGSYFYDSLISDIESLRIYAGVHPKCNHFYRALSKRFPYSIYYKTDNTLIKIYAVLDNRKDPKSIVARLKEQS